MFVKAKEKNLRRRFARRDGIRSESRGLDATCSYVPSLVEGVRRNWFSRLRKAFLSFPAQPEGSLAPFEKEGVDRVTTQIFIVNITNMSTDNSTNYGPRFQGPVRIKGNLDNAFNSINNLGLSGERQELSERLKELHKVVTDLISKLPEKDGERVSRDLKALVDEASSAAPRRQWFELSAKGLLEAAEAVVPLLRPVSLAVAAVLELLTS